MLGIIRNLEMIYDVQEYGSGNHKTFYISRNLKCDIWLVSPKRGEVWGKATVKNHSKQKTEN